MAGEITIPALPCASINDTLTFYVALGFEITYQQTRPNTYACIKRDDIELHFFSMNGFEPANSYSTCLVLIHDADELYQSFAAGLRQHYGKLLVAGIPRITRPNNKNASGDYRFNVVDPGGNWIRFIQQTNNKVEDEPTGITTKLSRAIHAATLQAAHGDFLSAAKILDTALDRDESEATVVQRVQALILRAEVAANMDDYPLARSQLDDLHKLPLTAYDQLMLTDEFERADELAQMLEPPQ